MESWNIIYPEAQKVALEKQAVAEPGQHEVLCETTRTLISTGTEMTCLRGVFDPDTNWYGWVKYPFHPGYSTSARVLRVGDGVTKVKPGDRVWCEVEHRQYFTAPENGVHPIPEGVTDEQATWVPLMRVAQNIVRKCQIQMGDRVIVIGLGQVGQLVVEFVRLCGATAIIGIDPIAMRCEKAKISGATHVLPLQAHQAVDEVKRILDGGLADVVIDATGHPKVLAAACLLARNYGKIGLVGDCSTPSQQALGPGVVNRYLTILGAHGSMTPPDDNVFYPWTYARTNAVSLTYVQQGKMLLDHLVTHRFSPAESPDVYQRVFRDGSPFIGVIFDWSALKA